MSNTVKKSPRQPSVPSEVPNRPPRGATPDEKRKWAQDFVCSRIPRDRKLVEELLADRRREAMRD